MGYKRTVKRDMRRVNGENKTKAASSFTHFVLRLTLNDYGGFF